MVEWFKAGPWFKHHIYRERHHLNEHVPDDVNLFDVLESVVDCVVAAMARTGEMRHPVEISNKVLQLALKNTVEQMLKDVVIKKE